MKKILKLVFVFCLLFTGCKEKKESIDYIDLYDVEWETTIFDYFKFRTATDHLKVDMSWKNNLSYLNSKFEYKEGDWSERKEYVIDVNDKSHSEYQYAEGTYIDTIDYSVDGKMEKGLYVTRSSAHKIEYYEKEYFDEVLIPTIIGDIIKNPEDYSLSPKLLSQSMSYVFYKDYSSYGVEYKVGKSDSFEPTYMMKSKQPFTSSVPDPYSIYGHGKNITFKNIDILVIKGVVIRWNVSLNNSTISLTNTIKLGK